MIKVQCNHCRWHGDLVTCGPIQLFDAARCPKCSAPVIAYKLLEKVKEARRLERMGHKSYSYEDLYRERGSHASVSQLLLPQEN